MAAPSCIPHFRSNRIATQTVNSLSEAQRQAFGINEKDKNDAIGVFASVLERRINAIPESKSVQRDRMENDIEGFISYLTSLLSVKIPEDQYQNALQEYETIKNKLSKLVTGFSKLTHIEVTEDESQQESVTILEAFLMSHPTFFKEGVNYYINRLPNEKIASISIILREPQKEEGVTAQQKTLNTLDRIKSASEMEVYNPNNPKEKAWVPSPSEMPEDWRPTGNYRVNGKDIKAKGVTRLSNNGPYTGPVLSSPIGTSADTVGRLVFRKEGIEEGTHPLYNKDGSLKDPDKNKEELQEFINKKLKGLYTVKGLINLANDFLKLEKQLKSVWGEDIKIITDEIGFFGQMEDGSWIVGYPDMLIVDGKGIIHTLDFKTHLITNLDGYINVFHDDSEDKWHTGRKYGTQVTAYNRLQESYNLTVDLNPFVVLIDTWYDSSDTIASREEGAPKKYQDKGKTVGILNANGEITSFGEYAEKNPVSRKDILIDDTGREILYMEPRLHINISEDAGGTITYSEELAALRDRSDIPFDPEISFEQQWEALPDDEKEEVKWLFNAQPISFRTEQKIVTRSENAINSNPKLISEQEIQDVADFLMYRVSRIITDLQKGKHYDDIPLSGSSTNESQSSDLQGKSRAEIINMVGIDKLIDTAFQFIWNKYDKDFPTEQEYKNDDYDDLTYSFEDEADYQNQKRINDKAQWLTDSHGEWNTNHKEQLIRRGNAKLIALENSIIPKKNDSRNFDQSTPDTRTPVENNEAIGEMGDTESVQSFIDKYQEGQASLEAWMLGVRNYSPKASLAQELKRMFEDIDMVDDNGKPIIDSYGWGFSVPLNSTMAVQTVLDACKNCESIEEMLDALEKLANNPKNAWINQVIDIIKAKPNKNLLKKFFRNFRKDYLNYSIAQVKFDKKTGKRVVEVKIINTKSAYETITQSLGVSFFGGLVGNYTIDGQTYSFIKRDAATGKNKLTVYGKSTVASKIMEDCDIWDKRLRKLYKEGRFKEDQSAYVSEQLENKLFIDETDNKEKSIIQKLTEILNGIGILVTPDVVKGACLAKLSKADGLNGNPHSLFKYCNTALQQAITQNTSKTGIPDSLTGNNAGRGYFPILRMLSEHIPEQIEASVYQDGKTYYSYTNPSRLGHIIRNLTDAIGDPDKFEKYIQDNFGRYTGWFKSVDGTEWWNDWLKQLTDRGSAAREALAHKVELSYIGNQYRNLGALGFQLSILHNYFGSKNDTASNPEYRWFALPTMSNKPTNEFIRMLKYKDKEEIIGRLQDDGSWSGVLMNTFKQEMSRIADVLFHFANFDDDVATDQIDLTNKKLKDAGWTIEEIKALKDRINTHSITAQDMQRLSTVTSGAKFHFLWYLNDDWNLEDAPQFGTALADMLNLLLTPEKNKTEQLDFDTLSAVREVISYHMDDVVESELKRMEDIGLFDIETKKVKNAKGEDVKIKVLKYQEEFDDKLGNSKHGYDNAVEEMREALRDFIWQDIAANINIIQITGGDLAYYGNAVNYQKRIAQIHSPGWKLMHDDEYDDGYLRSVHISDEMIRDEIKTNTEVVLNKYMETSGLSGSAKEDYSKMISIILDGLTKTVGTDGQSFSSPTSIRKKLALQGEWSDEREEAYKAICKGDFNINHLGVMIQPSKPFVTSDMAKYSGSTTMELRRVPLQDKNSEYLIILAEALARGAGKKSKLVAICDFMEATHKFGNGKSGIDTTHFGSVNKVGKSGVIDIGAFDKQFNIWLENKEVTEDDYNKLLSEYLLQHVRPAGVGTHRHSGIVNRALQMAESQKTEGPRHQSAGIVGATLDSTVRHHVQDWNDFDENERLVSEGKLKREEVLYNSQYVDTIPLDDYIIQQEVPAHLLNKFGQLYGSQIRILGISDITPGTDFEVWNSATGSYESMPDHNKNGQKGLVEEYKELHAQNIRESFDDLMKEMGIEDIDALIQKWVATGRLLSKEAFIQKNDIPNSTKKQQIDADRTYRDYIRSNTFESIADLPIGTPERNTFFKNMESLLQKELTKDAKYGSDTYEACTLQYDDFGNVIDFTVPLMDPTQSRRIQELINSIIKNNINKQKIAGGPVVQTTAYDKNLHIRFKDKKGNILPTLEEFGGDVDAYKEYLKVNQAGIAYFECYMPIPNATLERLMTNPDGSMMSYNELFDHEEDGKTVKGKLPAKVQKALTEIIGYRIPTEDKYSMLPLKIVGFVPKAAGQVIMMPQEIVYLTGSDFDIDKMYIMMKAFNIQAPKVKKEDKADYWKKLAREYFNETGKRRNDDWEQTIKDIIKIGDDILYGNEKAWRKESITRTPNTKWEDVVAFITWYRNRLITEAFEEFTNQQDEKKLNAKKARDNRILDLQWAVLTNEDTASKLLNPGNFNDQKKIGRIIRILKDKIINPKTNTTWTFKELYGDSENKGLSIKELDALLESAEQHNTTLPSSKIYFQRQNMQGSQMVGIFANHNVSHAFMTFQKVGINLQKDGHDNSFRFDNHDIGNLDNMEGMDSASVLDPQKGLNGQLISKTIASFLAASVDTAKDPVLSDLNVNTFTGGVAMVLARLGFDTAAIGLFLSQPVIMKLSDLYFKNSTDGFYKGDTAIEEMAASLGMKKTDLQNTDGIKDSTLSIDNFVSHLNDRVDADNEYQQRVLQGFYRLYQIAHDLSDLTFCTKFNSVSNAVGPTIADTLEDMDRVEKFMSNEKSVFYIPETDNDPRGFTDPAEIIANDKILSAFYDTTVSLDGASDKIFKNFFPHYYEGFQNVREYFKQNFLGGKKISSKLYNQLLNEYVYYLLTYQDEEYSPTIPTLYQDSQNKYKYLDHLVKGLVHEFNDIVSIKGRKPNAILDQGLGNNCLRVRGADEFLAVDTLIFNNSQLNAEGQQKIKNAWTDLITMNDPNLSKEDNKKIRDFGIDLFFYNLMRNGFTFSPKTMMSLASVLVRYNANFNEKDGFQSYIDGLRKLKDVDKFLMNGADRMTAIKQFCNQFIRNHANNGQLIPKIDTQDSKYDAGIDTETHELVLQAPEKKETNLAKVMVKDKTPYPFIIAITKSKNSITQDLYELVENNDGTTISTDGYGGIVIRYKKSKRLGLTNNFIEYSANSALETSYFEDIRNASEDDMNDEALSEGQSKDEQEKESYDTPESEPTFNEFWNTSVLPMLMSLKGPATGEKGKILRTKLKKAIEGAEDTSDLGKAFINFLNAKQEEKQEMLDSMIKVYNDENSCLKV